MGARLGSGEHGFPLLSGAGRLVIKDTAILAGAIVVLADSAKGVLKPNKKDSMMKQYDDIIIGFGKGGKTLAAELARQGHKVAMIERSDKMYGGTCINIGCIPTKTLVHAAKLAPHGVSWTDQKNYYAQAISKRRTCLPITPKELR